MAKTPQRYVPGWKHTIEIDGVAIQSMGVTVTPDGDSSDVMTNDDNGYTANETNTRTVKAAFSLPLKASQITTPPVEWGDIYPMTFSLNDVVKYDGDFRVTGAKVNASNKQTMTLDVEVENYGDVTPPPPGGAPPTVPGQESAATGPVEGGSSVSTASATDATTGTPGPSPGL